MNRALFIVLLVLLALIGNCKSLEPNSTTGEVTKEQAEVFASTVSLESAFKGFKGDDNKFEKVDEQTRVDTLVRALKRLPEGELSHYGLTSSLLEQTFTPGTKESEKLFEAWNIRQGELKKAVESMMKPAEYMQDLVKFIIPSYSGPSGSEPDKGEPKKKEFASRVVALEQLESLVEDIDNARDFNTIGGFRAIVEALINPDSGHAYSLEERSLAAAVIGNAVKNDYDFQLWVLEDNSLCLRGLLSMLCSSSKGDDIARRRALYALASASRGNADVQEYIVGMQEEDLPACLMDLVTAFTETETKTEEVSVELARKALAYISDMLTEHAFLQEQIRNPQGLDLPVEAEMGAMGEATMAGELMSQLHAIRLLGPSFCSKEWKVLSLRALDKASTLLLSATAAEEKGGDGDNGDININSDDTETQKQKESKSGWVRPLLSAIKSGFKSRNHKKEGDSARSGRAFVAARRGTLENALAVFLQSSASCEPIHHIYSSTAGVEGGPGAVVASTKARLEQVQEWARDAGEAAGEVSERAAEALRFID